MMKFEQILITHHRKEVLNPEERATEKYNVMKCKKIQHDKIRIARDNLKTTFRAEINKATSFCPS